MEQPRPPAAPKPESTAHKVGRYLLGILGGLLLGVGIAAAVVATVASAGSIPGAILGIATIVGGSGIGTSLIAGTAGISLIGTAVMMRPVNPEALLPKDTAGVKQQMPEPKPLKFGEGEVQGIKDSLKKLDENFEEKPLNDSSKKSMDDVCAFFEKDDKTGAYKLPYKGFNWGYFYKFVDNVLDDNGANASEVSEKNVLLVRLAINQYVAGNKDNPDIIKAFNNKNTLKSISDFLK